MQILTCFFPISYKCILSYSQKKNIQYVILMYHPICNIHTSKLCMCVQLVNSKDQLTLPPAPSKQGSLE